MTNILLTGATGFVGGHLLEKLSDSPSYNIFPLVRKKGIHPNEIIGDVTTLSPTHFKELPSFDAVVHLAGVVHAVKSEDFYRVNVEGNKKLIEALSHQKIPLFINSSSLAAYGPKNKGFPVGNYGQSKKDGEEVLNNALSQGIITKLIHLRPPMVLGPRDTATLEIYQMVQKKIVPLIGFHGKEKKYSFVSVMDLTNKIMALLDHPTSENIIYPAFSQDITFWQLIEEIQKILAVKKIYPLIIPSSLLAFVAKYAPFLPSRLTEDKVRELLEDDWTVPSKDKTYNYCHNLEETLKRSIADYKKRGYL